MAPLGHHTWVLLFVPTLAKRNEDAKGNLSFNVFASGVNQIEGSRLRKQGCISECVWSVCRWLKPMLVGFCSIGGWCDSGWEIWEHLHSFKGVKCLQDYSKSLWMTI